jgi:SHS2 domain-containing protein
MQFPQGSELNVQGVGPTLGAVFAEAALAMIALLSDLAAIRLEETIEIEMRRAKR